MTREEGAALLSLVQRRWFNQHLEDPVLEQMLTDLSDLPYSHARAAVDSLYAEGKQFAPTAGEIRRRVTQFQLNPLEWFEVKRQIGEVAKGIGKEDFGWECPQGECDGSGWTLIKEGLGADSARHCACWDEREIARRSSAIVAHPLVTAFLREVPLSDCLDMLGGDTTVEAQTREKWKAFSARAVGDIHAAEFVQGGDDLPALQQARARAREGEGELIRGPWGEALRELKPGDPKDVPE